MIKDYTVSRAVLPKLFDAVVSLDYASGCVNRQEPERAELRIPDVFWELAVQAEVGLVFAQLTPEELEILTDGEDDARKALIHSKKLSTTAEFLDVYFNGLVG